MNGGKTNYGYGDYLVAFEAKTDADFGSVDEVSPVPLIVDGQGQAIEQNGTYWPTVKPGEQSGIYTFAIVNQSDSEMTLVGGPAVSMTVMTLAPTAWCTNQKRTALPAMTGFTTFQMRFGPSEFLDRDGQSDQRA